jgi:hypothetical protein
MDSTQTRSAVALLAAALLVSACRGRDSTPGADTVIAGRHDAVPPPPPNAELSPADAADVIRRYYAAIDAHDFRSAYALWASNGEASKQTFEQFVAGFDSTRRVSVDAGAPGRVEGAAGSRYVTIPVTVRAETTTGREQRFVGSYTLRRSVVDGATPDQRQWRIYSASITRASR